MINCGAFETCKLVRAFYANTSGDREISTILKRRLEMIKENPAELVLVHACIRANANCYLATRSEQGYDRQLEELLKPLQP